MSRITMKSKKSQLVLQTIKDEGTATSRQLVERTCISKPMVGLILRMLHATELIHVSGYVMTNGCSVTRVFSYGKNEDVLRPIRVKKAGSIAFPEVSKIRCDVAASWLFNALPRRAA